MMDTILNVGLSSLAFGGLVGESGSLNWASDLLSTLISSFPDATVPADATTQLLQAVERIFGSWNNQRARLYRRLHHVDDNTGTAVVVQVMVFGNYSSDCCSGVLFSRDPVSGVATPAGNWASGVQGEVIVAGSETGHSIPELKVWSPTVHSKLLEAMHILEQMEAAPQDIEFTVERGQLHLLQCRPMKANALARCQIYLDMFGEGILGISDLRDRLMKLSLDGLFSETVTTAMPALAQGTPASSGVRSGHCVRDPGEAVRRARDGEDVVLVRPETSPKDLAAMKASVAIVTERGGETSHAAIVARELGIPCVVACADLSALGDAMIVTVDGSSGRIYPGRLEPVHTTPDVVARAKAILAGSIDAVPND
jgi:pyruvate,orthophosphate dikinase